MCCPTIGVLFSFLLSCLLGIQTEVRTAFVFCVFVVVLHNSVLFGVEVLHVEYCLIVYSTTVVLLFFVRYIYILIAPRVTLFVSGEMLSVVGFGLKLKLKLFCLYLTTCIRMASQGKQGGVWRRTF